MNIINKTESRASWQYDINMYINTNNIIALVGNVSDITLSLDGEGYCSIPEFINDLLALKGYKQENIKFFDSIKGSYELDQDNATSVISGNRSRKRPLEALALAVDKEFNNKNAAPTAYIVPNASFFTADSSNITTEESDCWSMIRISGCENKHKSKIIFLFNDIADVPISFSKAPNFCKIITVARPDQTHKNDFIKFHFPSMTNADCEAIATASEGITLDETGLVIYNVCRTNMNPTKDEVIKALKGYIYGYVESPWKKLSKEKIEGLNAHLKKYIKGQDEAIDEFCRQVKQVYNGTTDMLYGEHAPRAIFVLPGLTGTGKTELARQSAKYLFGDESAMIRINCNEYKESHTLQRLVGAPPSYVGYNAGGELTNKVRANPFSIVLFDELEKAHDNIYDYLLAIVEDGKINDSRGLLANFNNTIIIMTTNVGARAASRCDSNDEAKQVMYDALEAHFDSINRREVFGRLKNHILPFNKINSDAANSIVDIHLNHIIESYKNKYNIELQFSQESMSYFYDVCNQNTEYGGRDVKNTFISTVSNAICDINDNVPLDRAGKIYINNICLDPSNLNKIVFDYTYEEGESSLPVSTNDDYSFNVVSTVVDEVDNASNYNQTRSVPVREYGNENTNLRPRPVSAPVTNLDSSNTTNDVDYNTMNGTDNIYDIDTNGAFPSTFRRRRGQASH